MSTLHLVAHHTAGAFKLDVDTHLELAGVTGVFGPSGSGKTSVLDCIAGLRPDIIDAQVRFGSEYWQGGDVFTPPWKRNLAYVFQDARLFPHLTVTENLRFAARYASKAPDAPRFSLPDLVRWLDLAPLVDQRTATLSAGQQQRVAIARALARKPRLLLLDEPLANLDRSAARTCLACLQRIAAESELPMLYVSHNIEELATIADTLLLLDDGRVLEHGPLLELAGALDNPLAEDDSAAAILCVEIGERDERYALTRAHAGAAQLWLSAAGAPGSRHRLRIPARDVSVCLEPPKASSILNVLPVTLSEQRDLADSQCMLRLRLGDQYLLARISRRSRDELKLHVGDALFAQIKGTSLLSDELSP